jgi:hypothetical protein
MSLDSCAEEGSETLKLRLPPLTCRDVYVFIETVTTTQHGAVGFHLVDQRGGQDVGGVLLTCVSPAFVEPASQSVPAGRPCPAVLARAPYLIVAGDDPSQVPTKPIPPSASLELVAPITNPTAKPLKGTIAYLEHLGTSGVTFTPGTWNIGSLDAGAVFFASWPIQPGAAVASFDATVVVVSQGKDAVRLQGVIRLPRGEGRRPRTT